MNPMKISVVVNAYNRKNYIDRAIKSAEDADEIIAVVNFPYCPKVSKVKVIEIESSSIWFRYLSGMLETKNEVIALLDDDDYFINKIENLKKYNHFNDNIFLKDTSSSGNINGYDLKQIVRYHLDWDISKCSFSRVFIEYLKDCVNVEHSYDKFLYYIALKNEMDIRFINPTLTVKTHNKDSKMNDLKSNKSIKHFYNETSQMFREFSKNTSESIAKNYAEFQYRYNKYLTTKNTQILGEMKEYVPFNRLLYHKLRRE